MKIENTTFGCKCEFGGCGNIANYVIEYGESSRKGRLFLCGNCQKELYRKLGELYTPKSIKNKLNQSSQRDLKKMFSGDDKNAK